MNFFGALKLGIRYNILQEFCHFDAGEIYQPICFRCLLRRHDSAFYEKRKLSLYN